MSGIFPKAIRDLPIADIPLPGVRAYLSQGDNHQILFMEFDNDIELPEHSHDAQWGVVLDGKIELTVEGNQRTYTKGMHYLIPAGAVHSARIYAGYADISFFNERERYKPITD